MFSDLLQLIDDPLYRLALWVLFIQLMIVLVAIGIVMGMRALKPAMLDRRQRAQSLAQKMILRILNDPLYLEDGLTILRRLPKRPVFSAIELLTSRLGSTEKKQIRELSQDLELESLALSLAHSWFWWRRLEGVLLLGSVGTRRSEKTLIKKLNDPSTSVSFHAAWAMVRISPVDARYVIMGYLELDTGLSFSQKIRLLRELNLEEFNAEELEIFFNRCPDHLKPELIEAVVLSAQSHAKMLIRTGITSPLKEVRIASFKAASLSRFDLKDNDFKRGIEDDAWEVRAQAVKAVGEGRMINLTPNLARALGDSNWWVRQNASKALSQLGEVGLKALSHVAQLGEDRFARDAARQALSETLLSSDQRVHLRLKTIPISPIPSKLIPEQLSSILDPEHSNQLNTLELSALKVDHL